MATTIDITVVPGPYQSRPTVRAITGTDAQRIFRARCQCDGDRNVVIHGFSLRGMHNRFFKIITVTQVLPQHNQLIGIIRGAIFKGDITFQYVTIYHRIRDIDLAKQIASTRIQLQSNLCGVI